MGEMKKHNCIDCQNKYKNAIGLSNHRRYGCFTLRRSDVIIKNGLRHREWVYRFLKTKKGKERYRHYY